MKKLIATVLLGAIATQVDAQQIKHSDIDLVGMADPLAIISEPIFTAEITTLAKILTTNNTIEAAEPQCWYGESFMEDVWTDGVEDQSFITAFIRQLNKEAEELYESTDGSDINEADFIYAD